MMKEIVVTGIAWTTIALVWYMAFMVTVFATQYGDRRDVNRDGQVNLTDLSVLAVEIQEAKKAE